MTFDEWMASREAKSAFLSSDPAAMPRAAWHAAQIEMRTWVLKALQEYEGEVSAACEADYKEHGECSLYLAGMEQGVANAMARVEDLKLE